MSTPQQGPQQPFQPQQPMGQQPTYPQSPAPQQPYGAQPATLQPQPKPKRFGIFALGGAALAGLLLGSIIVGSASGGADPATAGPAPTVTVTASAPAVEGESEPTEAPTEEPTAESASETYDPKKSDFELSVKTLSKECFGSAGCNVSFRIKPSYVGTQALPTSGEIEVTYKITGLEDPVENTFTVDGEGTITYTKEENGQTASKGDKLGAKVTDVEYTP